MVRVETGENDRQAECDQESSDEVSFDPRSSQTVDLGVFAAFVQPVQCVVHDEIQDQVFGMVKYQEEWRDTGNHCSRKGN